MTCARNPGAARSQAGALMIEVLIAILVCALGLIGLFGVQARATSSQFESYQRSQALVLTADIVSRINANRANAADYVTGTLIGEGPVVDCAGMTGAALDLCEWGNLLRGSTELRQSIAVGAMVSARGCITRAADASDRYLISVVWQGMLPSGSPANTCGQGDPLFPDDSLRRAASTTLCIGSLRDTAASPAVPRC